MGFWSDFKKNRERAQRHKEYVRKYADYLKVEDDVKRMMNETPPDKKGVIDILKDIETIPNDAENMLALCYASRDPSKALEIVKMEYELDKKRGDKPVYPVEDAIYEYAMGYMKSGIESFSHFSKGGSIVIPSYEPEYFKVIPHLCKVCKAAIFFYGDGVEKSNDMAKMYCRNILEKDLIPEGYSERALAERIMKEIAEEEEAERRKEEQEKEKARQEEEQKKERELVEEERAGILSMAKDLYDKDYQEKVESLLQEETPKYSEVKDILYKFGTAILPDTGKLYLAVSIRKAMELNEDLTEEQKKAEKDSFEKILYSIETESAALNYYKSLDKSKEVYEKYIKKGAKCAEQTNIYDRELRKECLKKYAENLYRGDIFGTKKQEIETGEGKQLYDEMKWAACAYTGKTYSDDFELWNDILSDILSEGLYKYAFYAVALLVKRFDKNNGEAERRRLLQEKYSDFKLKKLGYFHFKESGYKNLGYYFYDALLSKKGTETIDTDGLTASEFLISYCTNNDYMKDAYFYGDYALRARGLTEKDYCYHIHDWMMQGNNGYFLTDDRPDENGMYTDNGRIRAGAFRASVIYDGVLG